VKSTSEINKFVGMKLVNKGNSIEIHQEKLINKVAKQYKLDRGYLSPMLINLQWDEKSIKMMNIKPLQKLFGELNYIACVSRPDTSFAVNKIARMLNKPTKEVFRSAKRILSYLVSTEKQRLIYKYWDKKPILEAYTDSSFADIKEDHFKSTGGYAIYYCKNLIAWKSKKIKYVCTSSTKAEYLALYITAKEVLFLGYLLKEGYNIDVFPIDIYCDNKGTIQALQRKGKTELNKFMATKFYKLYEWCERSLITIKKIASKENIADGFTKINKNYSEFVRSLYNSRGSVQDNIKGHEQFREKNNE